MKINQEHQEQIKDVLARMQRQINELQGKKDEQSNAIFKTEYPIDIGHSITCEGLNRAGYYVYTKITEDALKRTMCFNPDDKQDYDYMMEDAMNRSKNNLFENTERLKLKMAFEKELKEQARKKNEEDNRIMSVEDAVKEI